MKNIKPQKLKKRQYIPSFLHFKFNILQFCGYKFEIKNSP